MEPLAALQESVLDLLVLALLFRVLLLKRTDTKQKQKTEKNI